MTISGDTRDSIVAMLARRPLVSFKQIASFFDVSLITIQRIAHANGYSSIGRPK